MVLYHYYNNHEYVIDTIRNNRIWLSSFKQLNDPFEYLIPFYYKLDETGKEQELEKPVMINKRATNAGIFCLSKTRDEYLMWSHYAKSHQGICIGFNFERYFPKHNIASRQCTLDDKIMLYLEDVRYAGKNTLPLTVNNTFVAWHEDVIKIYSRKFKCWEYEAETRIISLSAGDCYYNWPDSPIVEVIFGKQCDLEIRKEILRVIDENKIEVDTFIEEIDLHTEGVKIIENKNLTTSSSG